MHMKMIPSSVLSPELRTQYAGDLLNPKIRLYDELTTLRFPARPGAEETSKLYRHACKLLTHASGEPIPYRFFKQEFLRLLEDCGCDEQSAPSELSERMLNNAIGSIGDIWLYQAYAALFLRVAESSETSNPKNAHRAWHAALNAYQRFFAEASVEDSCSFQVQKEEKFRQDCREAWDGFLADLVEGVYQRMGGYILQCDADRICACYRTLQLSTARVIQPNLLERAVQESLEPYARAIRNAPSLQIATELFDCCPEELLEYDKESQCKRAMLGAMKTAVEYLLKHERTEDSTEQGGASDLDRIMEWAERLDLVNQYTNGAVSLRKDMKDLFHSVASFVLAVNNNDKVNLTREMEFLLTILPDNYVVGTLRGENLNPSYFMGIFAKKNVIRLINGELYLGVSEREVRALGQKVQAYIDSIVPKGHFRDKTLGELNAAWVTNLRIRFSDEQMFQAGLEAFPDDWPIAGETTKTFRAVRRTAESARLESEALSLLEAARSAKSGTREEEEKLRALFLFACDHPEFDMNSNGACFPNLIDQVLVQAFVCNYNKRMKNPDEAQYLATMRICAGFLPEYTNLPNDTETVLWPSEILGRFGFERDELLAIRREEYEAAFEKKTRQTIPRLDASERSKLIWTEVLHLNPSAPDDAPERPENSANKDKDESPWRDWNEDPEDSFDEDSDEEPYWRIPVEFSELERKERKERRFTRLNGIRFRGGSVAAGIQYFLLAAVLPWLVQLGFIQILARLRSSPYLLAFSSSLILFLWLALVINGVFGLMANSENAKTAGFGKAARVFVWMAAALAILAVASVSLWPQSLLLRIVLSVYALILLFVTFHQIHKNAYLPSFIITLDGIPFHGGGIAVFFKYTVVQMFVPCIALSLIHIFQWQLSSTWIFWLNLYGVLLQCTILRAFFTCLAEDSRVTRFAKVMAAESFLIMPPAAGWYAIVYFNAFPLEWWVIVLLSVYGLFFLLGTAVALQLEK